MFRAESKMDVEPFKYVRLSIFNYQLGKVKLMASLSSYFIVSWLFHFV